MLFVSIFDETNTVLMKVSKISLKNICHKTNVKKEKKINDTDNISVHFIMQERVVLSLEVCYKIGRSNLPIGLCL